MLDVLRLENLVVDCIVGIYPTERLRPQPLRVDLALHLDTRPAATGAGLAGTVDYARLAGELRFLLTSCRFFLLETAAEALSRYILAPATEDAPHAAIQAVTLRLGKPAAFTDSRASLEGAMQPSLEVHRRAAELTYVSEPRPFGAIEIIHETRSTGIYRLRLDPGQSLPAHEHRQAEEAELVLGSGLLLEGKPVAAGTGHRWPRGASHRYDNPSPIPQTVLCVGRPATDEGEDADGISYFPPGTRSY